MGRKERETENTQGELIDSRFVIAKRRIGSGNIYKIDPATFEIVQIIKFNKHVSTEDYFIGARVEKLLENKIMVEHCKNMIRKVHKTGINLSGTFPIKLQNGVENSFIRFVKCIDGSVLAHT